MKKKNDILLIAGLLAVGIVLLIAGIRKSSDFSSPKLEVTVKGRLYGVYDLDRDITVSINDTNTFQIRNGKVTMTEADCPDQICVHSHAIDKNGGSIVCLPNQVILKIIDTQGEESGSEMDAIAGG